LNLRLLIDGVVRQTTVLIAQLSTASGVRAPLAHVADQVFVELAREIEAQGVRRQVVADMFGMALRSYQKKMRRLTESASVSERTLWQAVLDLVEREQPTRRRVLERFERDGEREVAAVLKDLVRSGLVSVTGTGNQALYAVTSQALREDEASFVFAGCLFAGDEPVECGSGEGCFRSLGGEVGCLFVDSTCVARGWANLDCSDPACSPP
jgi:hypothetical protein